MKATPEIAAALGMEHLKASNQFWHERLGLCFSGDAPLNYMHKTIVSKETALAAEKARKKIRDAFGL